MSQPRRPASLRTQVAATPTAEEAPGRRGELAEELVDALLTVGRADPGAALARADDLGVAALTEVWQHSEPSSRPATLLTLHVLRTWLQFRGEYAARLYRVGRASADVEDAVAGVGEAPEAADMAALGDAILLQAYAGGLAAAAQRAAAVLRVTAQGREPGDERDAQRSRRTADRLSQAGRTAAP